MTPKPSRVRQLVCSSQLIRFANPALLSASVGMAVRGCATGEGGSQGIDRCVATAIYSFGNASLLFGRCDDMS